MARKVNIKKDVFSLPVMMVRNPIIFSEQEQLKMKRMTGEAPHLSEHLKRMVACIQAAQAKKQNANVPRCIMNSECSKERVDYTNCIIKYQASPYLCKVMKRELRDCYGHFAKSYNMVLN